jgi:hypothetical protein
MKVSSLVCGSDEERKMFRHIANKITEQEEKESVNLLFAVLVGEKPIEKVRNLLNDGSNVNSINTSRCKKLNVKIFAQYLY